MLTTDHGRKPQKKVILSVPLALSLSTPREPYNSSFARFKRQGEAFPTWGEGVGLPFPSAFSAVSSTSQSTPISGLLFRAKA